MINTSDIARSGIRYNITPHDLDIDSVFRDIFNVDNNITAVVLGDVDNNNNNNNNNITNKKF